MQLIGTDVGRYRVVSLIGSGGMGDIYDAVDPSLGRHVALKILKSEAVGDPKRVSRFVQEARSASALNHPHLVSIYEIGEHEHIHFIAMEKIDGTTLRDLLVGQTVPLNRRLELMLQITEAVAAAHGAGIIHRDLKPENVMITRDGYAKVLDFGLSKLRADNSLLSADSATVARTTDSGTILGSVGYMSPEQAQGKHVDHRTDIFALGCILYEVVGGKPAFHGGTVIDTLHQTVHAEPASLQEIAPHTPASVQLVVKKALAKNLEGRYQSAKEMAVDLRNALSSGESATAVMTAERPKTPSSIAVLPFQNITGDPEHAYIVDGITEDVIHRLSESTGLRVMARGTVFRFRGADVDPLQAGRQLGVASVVNGRITVRRSRVIIDAELIDTGDGACLWGKRFERPLGELEKTQQDVAAAISRQLRIKLSPSQEKRIRKKQKVDREAYRLYLQGRFWWNKRPQEGFMKGLDLFQQSIERDPLFALAYAGIADAYAILGSWEAGLMAPRDSMPRAKAAASRAIELDPQLADPWASLGYILLHYDWDWEGSRKAFARATELNPNSVNAHHWLSHLHTAMRETGQSLDESHRTSDLDPLDLIANVHLAWHYWMAGDPAGVIDQSRKTATLEPNSFWPSFFEGLGYELRSELGVAAEKLRQARDRVPNATFPAAALAHVVGRKGSVEDALAVLKDLDRIATKGYVPAYDRAIVNLGAGRVDEAFTWLDRAYDERSGWLAYLRVEPRLESIRSDPRFARLCERVGLGQVH